MTLLATGCTGKKPAQKHAYPVTAPQSLIRHWKHPLPPQGQAPARWTALEKSLHPDQCGVCHPAQKAAWQTSRHALATGPGYHGQLLKMVANPKQKKNMYLMCSRCHTPLHEQRELLPSGARNPDFDQALYKTGLSCAGCHVRAHQRHGPPGRTPPMPQPPHGGYKANTFFQKSEFCANCHQFAPNGPSLKGKLFENTWQEWKNSRFAKEGVPCQGCHMPDRQHQWRGIHDPDMVKKGLRLTPSPAPVAGKDGQIRVTLAVKSEWIGHLFPTYLPPMVFVDFDQMDHRGRAIGGTRQRHRIGWWVKGLKEEVADTRLKPGETRRFHYTISPTPQTRAVRVRLWVDPDHFYRKVFSDGLRREQPQATVRAFRQAIAHADQNRFTVLQKTWPLR